MPATKLLSDNGVSSGITGYQLTGGNDGTLELQTTTAGGTATTAMTITASQNVGIGTSSPSVNFEVTGGGAPNIKVSSPSNVYTYLTMNAWGLDRAQLRAEGASGGGSGSGGGVLTLRTANSSGTMTEVARLDKDGLLQFNSGYGSVATAYGCRAWVNFNGTGTVAIRASGNVSSITDNGAGNYTVNFTTAMPDANYSQSGIFGNGSTKDWLVFMLTGAVTSSSLQIFITNSAGVSADFAVIGVSIFR